MGLVEHATLRFERVYRASPSAVFDAWANPESKASWMLEFPGEHSLDFQVGGSELIRAVIPNGQRMEFASVYHDIVPEQRIVYSSTLSADGELATVSVTSVLLEPQGGGTRLLLTEQMASLDGREKPEWREEGTNGWLNKLGDFVENAAAGSTSR